ncbi:288_t:CDS:1, partial [Dentiscutata erythropus]
MDSQLSYHFNLLISAVINFLISINNIYFQQHSHSTFSPNLFDIEQPPNYTSRHESINDFLEKNRNINKYEFFLKTNDIDRINTKHQYIYGLNGGS